MSVLKILRFIASHPLNEGQKTKALWRFAKWQVGSRLLPGEVVYDWVAGSKFLVRPGETGLTGNIYSGFQEFAEMAYLVHVLRADDLFVDVGANVGSYTILACAAVGAKGCAIEPVPGTYSRLLENIRINHLDDTVESYNVAIGSQQGVVHFSSDMDVGNRALMPGERRAGEVVVPVTTLDELLRERSPSLIKIDVEGYETAVLQGASQTLARPSLHSVIMEVNGSGEKYGFDESVILQTMADFGFAGYAYSPWRREIAALSSGQAHQDNIIFIRQPDLVRDRLKSAPSIAVHGKQL